MGREPKLTAFESRALMAAHVADSIETALARSLAERGRASIAVSGGATPEALYRTLSQRRLDWSRVTAVLVDERWVPSGDAASNEAFIARTLATDCAAGVRVIGLWSDASSPAEGLEAAAARLANVEPPFDVVILGMGADGHTASWFPESEGLSAALSRESARVAAIKARRSIAAGDHLDRISLTLGAVADARLIFLLIAGADKRAAFEAALGEGVIEEMPVRAILRARPDIYACWAP